MGVLDRAAQRQANGETFALATVVRTVSVTAAKAGAKALINPDGSIEEGWIGGGCARAAVLKAARQCMLDGKSRLVSIAPKDLLADLGVAPGEDKDGVFYAKNSCPSQGTMDIFVEPVLPSPRLLILGASPVAVELAKLAPLMGFAVTVAAPPGDLARFEGACAKVEGFAPPANFGAQGYVVVCHPRRRRPRRARRCGSDTRALSRVRRFEAQGRDSARGTCRGGRPAGGACCDKSPRRASIFRRSRRKRSRFLSSPRWSPRGARPNSQRPRARRLQKEPHHERDVCLGSAALVAHRTKVSRAFSPVPGDVGRADGHRPAELLPERTPYVRRGDGQFRPDLPRSTLAAELANWVMKAGREQAPFAGKLIVSDLDPRTYRISSEGRLRWLRQG